MRAEPIALRLSCIGGLWDYASREIELRLEEGRRMEEEDPDV